MICVWHVSPATSPDPDGQTGAGWSNGRRELHFSRILFEERSSNRQTPLLLQGDATVRRIQRRNTELQLDRDRAQEELTAARAEVIALRTALQGAQEELAHKVHQLEMMMKKMQATAETASAAANAKIHALEGELAKRGWRRTVFG